MYNVIPWVCPDFRNSSLNFSNLVGIKTTSTTTSFSGTAYKHSRRTLMQLLGESLYRDQLEFSLIYFKIKYRNFAILTFIYITSIVNWLQWASLFRLSGCDLKTSMLTGSYILSINWLRQNMFEFFPCKEIMCFKGKEKKNELIIHALICVSIRREQTCPK